MSQAKVDQYKKEKASRKKTIARQKFGKLVAQICGYLVIAAILFFAGRGIYQHYENTREKETFYIDTTELSNYLNGLSDTAE